MLEKDVISPAAYLARLRRLRRKTRLRELVKETTIEPSSLIYPIFVKEGLGRPEPISSMPGIFRYPIDVAVQEIGEARGLGLNAFLIFGIPMRKDAKGSEAYNRDGIVQRCVRRIRESIGDDVIVVTDVCLCQYTDHGHCGIVEDGLVVNDETVKLLALTALTHAEAGADMVAPSSMMDHQVAAIRKALDDAGFTDVAVMGYSAKYASAFYGPFRDAAYSAPRFGDRKTYQMDFRNVREAVREIQADIREGADIVMVKPALAYLDVIARARGLFNHPLAAYNVSGEYTMLKLAAAAGMIDEKQGVYEVLTAIKRAGADLIISYHAKDFLRWRSEGWLP